ncbi:MAG: hypothetical protein JWM00_52 [Candidatus Saccharibacteria bacterium]|nr:hypothetical protein [Candidatus Saccharibacteria bacterium]
MVRRQTLGSTVEQPDVLRVPMSPQVGLHQLMGVGDVEPASTGMPHRHLSVSTANRDVLAYRHLADEDVVRIDDRDTSTHLRVVSAAVLIANPDVVLHVGELDPSNHRGVEDPHVPGPVGDDILVDVNTNEVACLVFGNAHIIVDAPSNGADAPEISLAVVHGVRYRALLDTRRRFLVAARHGGIGLTRRRLFLHDALVGVDGLAVGIPVLVVGVTLVLERRDDVLAVLMIRTEVTVVYAGLGDTLDQHVRVAIASRRVTNGDLFVLVTVTTICLGRVLVLVTVVTTPVPGSRRRRVVSPTAGDTHRSRAEHSEDQHDRSKERQHQLQPSRPLTRTHGNT